MKSSFYEHFVEDFKKNFVLTENNLYIRTNTLSTQTKPGSNTEKDWLHGPLKT